MINPLDKQTEGVLYEIFKDNYSDKNKKMDKNNEDLFRQIVDDLLSEKFDNREEELKEAMKKNLLKDGAIMECGTNHINGYDGCSIVGYNSEKITYFNIPPDRKNDWVMSAKFTGCLFALGTATRAFGNFTQGELYAFHVHPMAYYAWEELKKEMENVHEINPYQLAYGPPSSTTDDSVTAFINADSLQAILWKHKESEYIQSDIRTAAINSQYYEEQFKRLVDCEKYFIQRSEQQRKQEELYSSESCCQIL